MIGVASLGHNHAVDWWTLGILAFELMAGTPPFEAPTPMKTYQKVKDGIGKVVFPAKCKGPLEDFVKNLCKANPSERLPMMKGGADNIRKHAWYNGFDWDKFDNLTMPVPYLPAVKSRTDTANFSASEEDFPLQVDYADDGMGWDKNFATSS